jgi:NADH dehydrogenase (ubiquinone) 1 alpha subcomplex subunit 6
MALRVASEKVVRSKSSPAVTLYRYITKQVPRVLTLYDISMEPAEARLAIQALFRKNAEIKDPRVIDMLITKANMELEETLMQWKQKVHLLTLLETGTQLRTKEEDDAIDAFEKSMEKFYANLDEDEDDDWDETKEIIKS